VQIYSVLGERIVRKPVYERRELSDFLEENGVVVADEVMRRWSTEIPLGATRRDGSFNICGNCGGLLYSATGQVTSERRRKPFQLARGAMAGELQILVAGFKTNPAPLVPTAPAYPTKHFAETVRAVGSGYQGEHGPSRLAPGRSKDDRCRAKRVLLAGSCGRLKRLRSEDLKPSPVHPGL
jgi:hypothetical protein